MQDNEVANIEHETRKATNESLSSLPFFFPYSGICKEGVSNAKQ